MVIIVPIVAIVALASLAMGRMYSRREAQPNVRAQLPNAEFDERLERVSRAVDVIAVELERISESQRFLARVLADPGGSPEFKGKAEVRPLEDTPE